MPTQVQIRGAAQASQEVRTLVTRELDVNTTDKRINIHDGLTAGGIPHVNCFDHQNQEFIYAAASGTNALTVTLAAAPSAYAAGQKFSFRAANANTASTTLNVNSLGAKTIKKISNGSVVALEGGEIAQNGIYEVTYDGTDFLLSAGSGGSSAPIATSTVSSSVSSVDFDSIFQLGYAYDVYIDDLSMDANWDLRVRFSSGGTPQSSAAYEMAQLNTLLGTDVQAGQNSMEITNDLTFSTNTMSGILHFWNPLNSGDEPRMTWEFYYPDATTGTPEKTSGAAHYDTNYSYDGFQLLPGGSASNITSGYIAVYERALS